MKISIKILISFFLCWGTKCFCQNSGLIPYKGYFESELKDWTKSFKDFQLSKFRLVDTLSFENLAYDDISNLKEFYKLYKPGLSFSADSTQFLDIYSYWLNLEKRGDKIVSNPEVDQLVSLCDLKNHTWNRIFFCGVSIRIEDAIWLTDTKFILAGTLIDESHVFHPKVLVGDTRRQALMAYTDTSSVAIRNGYVSTKLKRLKIQDQ